MELNIVSINCRGAIKDKIKRNILKEYFLSNEINIALLQETHIGNMDFKEIIEKEYKCKSYWSFGSNNSRGVAILIFENFDFTMKKFQRDSDGRVISVDIHFNSIDLKIVSIYCPNDKSERNIFLKNMNLFLRGRTPLIVGGDWNFVENLKLDKFGGNEKEGDSGSVIFKQIKEALCIKDPFRHLNKDAKVYTWFDEVSQIKTRLDRFYMDKFLIDKVSSVYTTYSGVSDHYSVKMKLNFSNSKYFRSGRGIWKFNNNLLENEEFIRKIEHYFNSNFQDSNNFSLQDWEKCKENFKLIAMAHSKNLTKESFLNLKKLEEALRQIDCLILDCQNVTLLERLILEKKEIKARITNFYNEKYKGAIIRAKCKILNDNEEPNSHFLKLELKNGKESKIESLINKDGNLTTSTDQNVKLCEEFYKELYKFEKIENTEADYFISNLPKIPSHIILECDREISIEELFEILKELNKNVTPGSDGLTTEFYIKFWYLVGKHFSTMVKNIFIANELSNSQKEGIIKLVCKNKEFKNNLDYYRPISILNTDYKIIAKTLAIRLKKALPFIINEDQSFGIPGRTIQNNLIRLSAMFQYIECKNIPAIFLNVDQEKAFDRVAHKYLFKVLKNFGFGPSFRKWIKILYKNIYSRILVNGFTSTIIKILRSVRQGCPIAPLLYVLVIETLLWNLRHNDSIMGIRAPCSAEIHLISAFADDTNFFLSNLSSTEMVLKTFNKFSLASGSKINNNKTEAIWLGSLKENINTPLGIKWVKSTKCLGIYFGFNNLDEQNWLKCEEKYRSALIMNMNRDCTLYGKTNIINFLGYSKIWYKALVLLLPKTTIKNKNGKYINIEKEIELYTQGFLWGFNKQSDHKIVITKPVDALNNKSCRQTRQVIVRPFPQSGIEK